MEEDDFNALKLLGVLLRQKKAYKEGRPIMEVALEETDLSESRLKKLLDPTKLTKGGLSK